MPGMNRNLFIIGAAVVAIVAVVSIAAFFQSGGETPARAFIDPADKALVARGKAVYSAHCASCHGASLEGQPDWRKRRPDGRLPAPPHDQTGHTWHHPDDLLVDIVKNGLVPGRTAPDGYQSDMPAFAQLLTDSDIVAVLAYIKSNWPAEILETQSNMPLQRSQK